MVWRLAVAFVLSTSLALAQGEVVWTPQDKLWGGRYAALRNQLPTLTIRGRTYDAAKSPEDADAMMRLGGRRVLIAYALESAASQKRLNAGEEWPLIYFHGLLGETLPRARSDRLYLQLLQEDAARKEKEARAAEAAAKRQAAQEQKAADKARKQLRALAEGLARFARSLMPRLP